MRVGDEFSEGEGHIDADENRCPLDINYLVSNEMKGDKL